MRTRRHRALTASAGAIVLALAAGACSSTSTTESGSGGTSGESGSGAIIVSGSSTVLPITQRVAELWEDTGAEATVTVDGPGTGDGFKLFCKGETAISDASRPIKAEEAATCKENGVEFIELKVAIDGMAVMVNPSDPLTCVTLEDIYAIVGPESNGFSTWGQAAALAAELGSTTTFPDGDLNVSAPGQESGTYDSFVELALLDIGEARVAAGKVEGDEDGAPKESTRKDYSSQANDNAIIQGITGSPGSFGWVGFAYAEENLDKVKVLEVDGGDGCVAPTAETISSGEYPLARDLYIYVNADKANDATVSSFVDFYLSPDGIAAVSEVGYVELAADDLAATQQVWESRETGTRDGGK